MKTRMRMALAGLFLLLAVNSMGQTVISSLQGNGQLSWTNAVDTNGLYRVEWAANAGGPWYRTFDRIGSLDGNSAKGFTVEVPMFYRVVKTTVQPPKDMVWIEGGDVVLGHLDSPSSPIRTNFISGFWMDAKEVTWDKWKVVYNWAITNGYTFDHSGLGKTNAHPVHTVSWYDCVKWCNARSQMEMLTPCYYAGPGFWPIYATGSINISNSWVNWNANGYRLPTSSEWEKAARGGRQSKRFPWGGDTIQHERANYFATNTYPYDTSPTYGDHPVAKQGSQPYTLPGGYFPANGFGLYDMAGNVWEWCWDWYEAPATNYLIDPRGPESGSERINHGGSWYNWANSARPAQRYSSDPFLNDNRSGFRCIKGP